MTISLFGDTYRVECDECGDTLETDLTRDDGFMAAVREAEQEGWGRRRVGGEWHNYCQCCMSNEAANEFSCV